MASGDYIFAISQQGVPVGKAADYQKVLDSRWNFIDIAAEQTVRGVKSDLVGGSTYYWVLPLLDHNLGYLPAFTFRDTSGLLTGNSRIFATKTQVLWRSLYTSGDPITTQILTGFLRVFAVDITTTYKAPIDVISAKPSTTPPLYGVKIPNEQATSTGMRDPEMSHFSLHTDAKALGVQQTGLQVVDASTSNRLVVDHNLSYPPSLQYAQVFTPADWSSGFANPLPFDDIITPLGAGQVGIMTSNSVTTTLTGAQSALAGRFAFMIVKDPVEVAI